MLRDWESISESDQSLRPEILPSDWEANSESDQSLRPETPPSDLSSIHVEKVWPSDSSLNSGVKWPTDDEQSLPSNLEQTSNLGRWSASHSELKYARIDEKLVPPNIKNQTMPSMSELSSTSHSELKCESDDKQLQPLTVEQTLPTESVPKIELHSELMSAKSSKRQLGPSDLSQMWLSDSDLRSASYSDLAESANEDKLCPSELKQKWPSSTSLSEPIMSDAEDDKIFSIAEEEILPFDDEENIVSLEEEEEINVISIDEDEIEATEKQPAPIRRSFLSALGRRVLSAGRILFCCGGCGRNREQLQVPTKWKYVPRASRVRE